MSRMNEIASLDFGLGETIDILRETVRDFAAREISSIATTCAR